ncbi:MAG: hypothetical protein M2R45_02900 [Verrucomicrobia subdivision 3 bacterium]|nr:hypothetical protein [Limisphaerales bacterium]MCS1414752.1 hypothetical protein [Limisphaerales bacterium]
MGARLRAGTNPFTSWRNTGEDCSVGFCARRDHFVSLLGEFFDRKGKSRDFRSKIVARELVFGQLIKLMKRSLGRGLENLMPFDLPGDLSSGKPAGSVEDSLLDPPSGVDRLIHGSTQMKLGEHPPSASTQPFSSATASEAMPARVPAWVFYLGDLVLMSAVVWMIVLKDQPMERSQVFLCLGLVILASAIGLWPWLRNVLYCQSLGQRVCLPEWSVAEKAVIGDGAKPLVIHLKEPHVAVEISETSWNGIHPKPHWINGPPNLPPGGVKALLDEAVKHFQQWKREGTGASESECDPSREGDERQQ